MHGSALESVTKNHTFVLEFFFFFFVLIPHYLKKKNLKLIFHHFIPQHKEAFLFKY